MRDPKVSVIIPVLSVNDYLKGESFPAFGKLEYPNFEVLVLPNEVTPTDKRLMKKYAWLRLVPTHEITRPAQKRDIGVEHARGEIIAFIDDDAYPTPTWLTKAAKVFRTTQADAVCGPGILPPNVNFWERVFDEVLKTWIGSGGLAFRFVPKIARDVDDYPSMNFLMKKSLFKKIGGFKSEYWPGEDSKLCEDIVTKEKGRIVYSPDVIIYHHRRNKLWPYLKQHGQYGFHRGAFFAHGDSNSRKLFYLAPTGFFLYLVLLIIFPSALFSIPLILYIALLSTVFVSAMKNTASLLIASTSAFVVWAMHMVYGAQFIKGFIKGSTRKASIY